MKTLCYSRFWAEKMGRDPVPKPRSLVMAGGFSSIEEMIRDVKRGVLVTRLWYVNFVDLRTLLLTGLTRDGNFLIENGRIAGPIRNFRFNESLASVLANIVAIGPSERSHGGLFGDAVISTPPLLVKEFAFTSKAAGIQVGLRLAHGDDDLADLLVALHKPVRIDDLLERKGFRNDRLQLAARQPVQHVLFPRRHSLWVANHLE